MKPLAHSERRGRAAQTYREHVEGVLAKASSNVQSLLPYTTSRHRDFYQNIVEAAACYHDLGKLSRANQEVLCGKRASRNLPIEHRDAGVKYLLGSNKESPAATLVYAHHYPGLPNLAEESSLEDSFRFEEALADTERYLAGYLDLHAKTTQGRRARTSDSQPRLSALEYRMLLSCVVDADYSDTAGEDLPSLNPRWSERTLRLDRYVADLGGGLDSTRNELRDELYMCCRDQSSQSALEFCDSPVGTGKTTAVFARALKIAAKNDLRHIIVVLPYTNIISQTVDVLRKAIVLTGEDPQEIVAEHHHQADFESVEYRHLASTWNAPVIVTTAVQFFETLASNKPAKLRKLHQLPGSFVLIDESHAALPPSLMPLAWRWLTELVNDWGCQVCLSSGTSYRFWEEPEFRRSKLTPVDAVVGADLRRKLERFEQKRLKLKVQADQIPNFGSVSELIDYLYRFQGPRIVVLNTVHSAGYLAKVLKNKGQDVLHLSTALTPNDRDKVIEEVKRRLRVSAGETRDWTLVATSCVECGLDFSFRTGFAELRSVQSYLQLGGRVNRNGEYEESYLNCFTITDANFKHNPSFETAQSVFRKLVDRDAFAQSSITDLVSQAFAMECRQLGGLSDAVNKADRTRAFADVAKQFKVIVEETVTVLVDPSVIMKVKSGEKISERDLQRGSVNLRPSILEKLRINTRELPHLEGDQYDDFLGYLKQLLP
jgi:CRISPR-associated endonuclease/helicase Cas3